MARKTLVKMVFGNKVYGIPAPETDIDYLEIFLPSINEILLDGYSDLLNEISLATFMGRLEQGNAVAYETLFTPKEYWVETSEEWEQFHNVATEFIHKKISVVKAGEEDFELMSTRLRVAQQFYQILTEGKITFPRPNAAQLIQIKEGNASGIAVLNLIDDIFTKIEYAFDEKNISDSFPSERARRFVLMLHLKQVLDNIHTIVGATHANDSTAQGTPS